MRKLAALFVSAAALSIFPAAAVAGPDGPEIHPWDTCQAEPCTDPVGHFTKPLGPIIDLEPVG